MANAGATTTEGYTETREVAVLRWSIAALRRMIEGCAFVSTQRDSRYALNAIHIEDDGGHYAYAIGMDERRLCAIRAELKPRANMSAKTLAGLLELDHGSQLLLSAKDCRAARIGTSADGMAKIRAMVRTRRRNGQDVKCKRWLEVSWRQKSGKNRERSARIEVIDGLFPRWLDVIPSPRERIGTWIGKAGEMLSDLEGPLDHNGWTIGCDNATTQASRPLPHWKYEGSAETVTLDLRMLAKWLGTLDEHIMVTIENHGPERPIVGRAATTIYVQMPIMR